MDSKKRDQIIDSLFEIDGVREISEVTGRFDIMVIMYAKSLNEMHKVVSEKISAKELVTKLSKIGIRIGALTERKLRIVFHHNEASPKNVHNFPPIKTPH